MAKRNTNLMAKLPRTAADVTVDGSKVMESVATTLAMPAQMQRSMAAAGQIQHICMMLEILVSQTPPPQFTQLWLSCKSLPSDALCSASGQRQRRATTSSISRGICIPSTSRCRCSEEAAGFAARLRPPVPEQLAASPSVRRLQVQSGLRRSAARPFPSNGNSHALPPHPTHQPNVLRAVAALQRRRESSRRGRREVQTGRGAPALSVLYVWTLNQEDVSNE
jgi:hypothetical protein